MLNPQIHGLDHFRALSRATERHDWRKPETGLIWRMGNHTFQTIDILPVCRAIGRESALVRFVEVGRRSQPWVMTMRGYWSILDTRAIGLNLSNQSTVKAMRRHERKERKRRMRIRRFLVREGLIVMDGGAA